MKGDIDKIIKPLIGQGQAFSIMTISQIKEQLGIAELRFHTQVSPEGVVSDFLRAWDNNSRTEIAVHKETAEKIAEDPKIAILSLKDNGIRVSASGLEYRSYIIVIYNDKPAYSF